MSEFQSGESGRRDVEIRQFDLEKRKESLREMINASIVQGRFDEALKAIESMPTFLGQDIEQYRGFRTACLIDIIWEASSRGDEHMAWAEQAAKLLGVERDETVAMLTDHAQEVATRLEWLRGESRT